MLFETNTPPPFYSSETFSLRSILPPSYSTGPRSFEDLTAVGENQPHPPYGLMQALTASVGQALNEAGGLRLTRLTANVSPGDTTLQVERSDGLPAPGRVIIDGIPYRYTQLSPGKLLGLSYTHGGLPVAGAASAHAIGSQVTDYSGTYSAIDQVNSALFVETAQGADLSVIGRNLGVPRAPSLQDDTQYRALIQALAYNPRGTMLGLRLVLDALVGPGNYSLSEKPLTAPCQVFVTVPGALFLNSISEGKAYLSAGQTAIASSNQVSVPQLALFASSLRPQQVNFLTACQLRTPDPAIWTPQTSPPGTDPHLTLETAFGQNAGNATAFNQTPGFLRYAASLAPAAEARLRTTLAFSLDGSLTPSETRGFGGRISDGAKALAWGCRQEDEQPRGLIGLISASDGSFINNAPTEIDLETFYVVELRKHGTGAFELYLDGALIDSAPYASASATTDYGADLGNLMGGATPHVQLLSLGFALRLSTEYLNLRPQTGLSASLTQGSAQLSFSAAALQPTDTGKALRIVRSAAKNPSGGNNNGTYRVSYVDSQHATLTLGSGTAQLSSANPSRVTLSGGYVLTYPDSLGQAIQIGPSARGNAGTYTITKLLDPARLTDFAAQPTSKAQKTNVCEVQGASFVAEQGVGYSLLPQFATEAAVNFELVDAAAHSADSQGRLLLAPRAPQTLPAVPLAVRTSNVRSAQVFDTHVPFVTLNADGTFSAAPFYVSDAVYFLEAYLQGVVAAGVRLNFSFS